MIGSASSRRSWVRSRRGLALLPGLALAALLGASVEARPAPAAGSGVVPEILPAFNFICQELRDGRNALRSGSLSEESFVDLVLDLFVRADSLSELLASKAPPARAYSPSSALARGFRYLKESLRANYEGIVGRNGCQFVAADLSLEAALAWRSGITGAELARP